MKGYTRRDFFKIVGAGSAVAASGCAEELPEKLVPYISQPDESITGVSNWYASTCGQCAGACGLIVRAREGRALKVEGNPEHPVNKGGVCSRGQASVQVLYDPDRIREPLVRKDGAGFQAVQGWTEFFDSLTPGLEGATYVVAKDLTGVNGKLLRELSAARSGFQVVSYKSQDEEAFDSAVEAAFGDYKQVNFDIESSDYILSVGTDFLESWKSPVEYSKGWSKGRGKTKTPNTMVYVGARLSATAANADRFIKCKHKDQKAFLIALLASLKSRATGAARTAISSLDAENAMAECGIDADKVKSVLKGLEEARTPVVLAGGPSVDEETTYLSFLLNSVLGSVGKTVLVTQQPASSAPSISYSEFLEKLEATQEEQKAILFVDVNPLFARSGARKFKQLTKKVKTLGYLGFHMNETASYCTHVAPMSHFLESWGDSEPRAGLYQIVQPVMQPLYDTLSAAEFYLRLSQIFGAKAVTLPDYLKESWKSVLGQNDFDKRWIEAVQTGFVEVSTPRMFAPLLARKRVEPATADDGISVICFETATMGDGAQANCAWLQEIPQALTTSVWASWIEIHPSLAQSNGLKKGDIVKLKTENGAVNAPAFITDYIDPGTVALPLGYGHTQLGRYANGVGVNALEVMPDSGLKSTVKSIVKNDVYGGKLITVQGSDSQLGRHLLKYTDYSSLHGKHDDHGGGHHHVYGHFVDGERIDMYEQMPHVAYHWGMNIDLSKCTGCSACVTACYAENNIPVVGKELCDEGREMSWLRINRFEVDEMSDHPERAEEQPIEGFLPMMCQHCANAPCEPVCPVYATYHNEEGMNVMVYNRCVGTRYCSNNCSYKVRRFNWFRYWWPEPLTWQLNPDVTVREVGIMEKCTFCIQRVRDAKNTAKNEGRMVKDGEVQTACSSTCPTDAITFGNLNDKSSEVYKKSKSKLSYKVLDEHLNTQPAVSYMKRIRNDQALT